MAAERQEQLPGEEAPLCEVLLRIHLAFLVGNLVFFYIRIGLQIGGLSSSSEVFLTLWYGAGLGPASLDVSCSR